MAGGWRSPGARGCKGDREPERGGGGRAPRRAPADAPRPAPPRPVPPGRYLEKYLAHFLETAEQHFMVGQRSVNT